MILNKQSGKVQGINFLQPPKNFPSTERTRSIGKFRLFMFYLFIYFLALFSFLSFLSLSCSLHLSFFLYFLLFSSSIFQPLSARAFNADCVHNAIEISVAIYFDWLSRRGCMQNRFHRMLFEQTSCGLYPFHLLIKFRNTRDANFELHG